MGDDSWENNAAWFRKRLAAEAGELFEAAADPSKSEEEIAGELVDTLFFAYHLFHARTTSELVTEAFKRAQSAKPPKAERDAAIRRILALTRPPVSGGKS